MPLADGADKISTNIKPYNLCLMKRIGIDAWVKKASDIRKTCFTKKIVIGISGAKRIRARENRFIIPINKKILKEIYCCSIINCTL